MTTPEERQAMLDAALQAPPLTRTQPGRKDLDLGLPRFSATTPATLPPFEEHRSKEEKELREAFFAIQEDQFGAVQSQELIFQDEPGFLGRAFMPIAMLYMTANELSGDRLTKNFQGLESFGEIVTGTFADAILALPPDDPGGIGPFRRLGIPDFGKAGQILQEGLAPFAPGSEGGVRISNAEREAAAKKFSQRNLPAQIALDPLNVLGGGFLRQGMKPLVKYAQKEAQRKAEYQANQEAIKRSRALAEKTRAAGFAVEDVTHTIGEGPISSNPFNIQVPQKVLTKSQRLANKLRSWNNNFEYKGLRLTPEFALTRADVQPVLDEARRVQKTAVSVGNAIGLQHGNELRALFNFDDAGGIRGLIGIDPDILGAPTIQDVAARLPHYLPHLTEAQLAAIRNIQISLKPFKDLIDEVSLRAMSKDEKALLAKIEEKMGVVETGGDEFVKLQQRHQAIIRRNLLFPYERPDIMAGGFYIPRGRTIKETEEIGKTRSIWGATGAQTGETKSARFDSMAQGISNGERYYTIEEVIQTHIMNMAKMSMDSEIAHIFKMMTEELTDNPLGITPKQQMMTQNPRIFKAWTAANKELKMLQNVYRGMSDSLANTIDEFISNPTFEDLDELVHLLDVKVMRGQSAGMSLADVQAAIKNTRTQLKEMRPEWRKALEQSRQISAENGRLNIQGMQNYAFPRAMAKAFNDGMETGRFTDFINGISYLNNVYRFMGATADVSFMGIQGLLAWYRNPSAAWDATQVALRSWGDPDVLGAFITDFNNFALEGGRLSAKDWAKYGLRVGGRDTEFALREGALGSLGEKFPFREVNRSFGFFGDSLRLEWADSMITTELRKGRSIGEIISSGDAQRIAEISNNMTGWSKNRFGGDIGEMLLFAPRFLQSRLETVSKGALGLLPGATVDQVAARQSLLYMIGWGTSATHAINWAMGRETQMDPRKPNFMTIRVGGRDWSLFGTWDSLLKAFILTAQGDIPQAIRRQGSGLFSVGADLVTGKDFVGEDIPHTFEEIAENPLRFAEWILSQVTPFALTDLPKSLGIIGTGVTDGNVGDVARGIAAITGEGTGIKSSPLSPFEELEELRRTAIREQGLDVEFIDLPLPERIKIDEQPDVVSAKQELAKSRRARSSRYQQYLDAVEKVRIEINEQITSSFETVGQSRVFRERVEELETKRQNKMEQIREDYADALEFLEELEPGTSEFDQDFKRYIEAISDNLEGDDNPGGLLVNPDTGFYDWKERERRIEALKLPEHRIAEIEWVFARHDVDAVRELENARRKLRPYWEQRDIAFAKIDKLRDEAIASGSEFLLLTGTKIPVGDKSVYELHKKFSVADSEKKRDWRLKPEYLPLMIAYRLENAEGGLKELWRHQYENEVDAGGNPTSRALGRAELERLLVEWGYLSQTINKLNIDYEIERRTGNILGSVDQ